ncbi:hypothetical protein EYF80_043779 [Liparis tanakae]|uniref:Uncharacterized protein n=1 Tax=Liparis tanakae TaxID=230148 RepID=A0A4Z2FZA0_9TELE|nr:hypothetical protein EYF80_043779 [Liparis tanakae]
MYEKSQVPGDRERTLPLKDTVLPPAAQSQNSELSVAVRVATRGQHFSSHRHQSAQIQYRPGPWRSVFPGPPSHGGRKAETGAPDLGS